jgi:ribosome-associated translation inhibitor RaiA
MKIIIKTKNFDNTADIEKFIEKKFLTLKKFISILKKDTPENLKTLAEVFIEMDKEGNHHRKGDIFSVKAQIILPGKNLTVSSNGDTLFKAIVKTRDEMKTEIEKYKFKKIDKNRRPQMKKEKNISK